MLKQIESSTDIRITGTSSPQGPLNITMKLKHKPKAADVVIQFVCTVCGVCVDRPKAIAENCGKLRKTAENCEKLRNCGKLRKIVDLNSSPP
jgi:hypothetical protein